jgi:hypothetical protein
MKDIIDQVVESVNLLPVALKIAATDCGRLDARETVEGFGKLCRAGDECPTAMIHDQDEKGPVYLCLYDCLKK